MAPSENNNIVVEEHANTLDDNDYMSSASIEPQALNKVNRVRGTLLVLVRLLCFSIFDLTGYCYCFGFTF